MRLSTRFIGIAAAAIIFAGASDGFAQGIQTTPFVILTPQDPPATVTATPWPSPSPTPAALTASFTATADTHIRNTGAAAGAATQARFSVGNPSGRGSVRQRGLVNFDAEPIRRFVGDYRILSARLTLYIGVSDRWSGAGDAVEVRAMRAGWNEKSATWANSGRTAWDMNTAAPADSPFLADATSEVAAPNAAGGSLEFDVTPDIASILTGVNGPNGWLVKAADESRPGRVDFYSRESSLKPKLTIQVVPISDPIPSGPPSNFTRDARYGDADLRIAALNSLTHDQRQGAIYGEAMLKHEVPTVRVKVNPMFLTPSLISNDFGFLTGPHANPADWRAILREYIDAHRDLFGVTSAILDQCRTLRDARDSKSRARTLILQLYKHNIQVQGCDLRATISSKGEIISIASTLIDFPDPPPVRRISAEAAVAAASRGAGIALSEPMRRAAVPAEVAAAGAVVFRGGADFPDSETSAGVQPVYLPISRSQLRMGLRVAQLMPDSGDPLSQIVDAENGRLYQRMKTVWGYGEDPVTYSIFRDPSYTNTPTPSDPNTYQPADSPTHMSPGLTFVPGALTPQPTFIGQALVSLVALDSADGTVPSLLSPEGWIPDGGSTLAGNNAVAKVAASSNPTGCYRNVGSTPSESGIPGTREFEYDYALDGDVVTGFYAGENRFGAATHAFYTVNFAHDRFYQIGFGEEQGAWQAQYFGPDRIPDTADDTTNPDYTNGAINLIIGDDDVLSLMSGAQMEIWEPVSIFYLHEVKLHLPMAGGPERNLDATGIKHRRCFAVDSQVVVHEYTHAVVEGTVWPVQDRGSEELTFAGLHEGWADFFSLALLADAGQDRDASYPMAAFSSYRLKLATGSQTQASPPACQVDAWFPNPSYHFNANYYFGIRRYPYSTNRALERVPKPS